MQANTKDAEVGYRIYREHEGNIALDALNGELRRRGQNPVALRTYEHFRRMFSYGVSGYMSINAFDQMRKRTPELVLATEEKHGQMIAHQLRNRIATMAAAVATMRTRLERGEPGAADATECLGTIMDELKTTDEFVDRYLKYSARPDPSFSEASLAAIVREVCERFSVRYADVQFTVSDEPAGSFAEIDVPLLTAAVENIVQNACRAMEGRGEMSIALRRAKRGMLEGYFRDSGPGISEQDRFKLFDVNYTRWPRGGGTGLGLAMVRKVVGDVHRGKVDITNRTDGSEGAEFWFQIPRKQRTKE